MALKKEMDLGNGYTAEYHVAELHENIVNNTTRIIMYSFKDKAARDAGKIPLKRERLCSDMGGIGKTKEQAYVFAKEEVIVGEDVEVDIKTGKTKTNSTQQINWFANSEDA